MTPPDTADDDQRAALLGEDGRLHGYTVASVARRLGVATPTLRTWDRRYGLGPSSHVAGRHRRYTVEDVDRLLLMRELTLDGVAPGDAARAALEAPAEDVRERARQSGFTEAALREADDTDDDPDTDDAADRDDAGTDAPQRPVLRAIDGGRDERPTGDRDRRAAAVRDPGTLVTDVVDAAIAYDEQRCDDLLRIDAEQDPAAWWTGIVEPARQRLQSRVVLAGPGEAPEVVLNNATLHAIRLYLQERSDIEGHAGNPPVSHPSRLRRIVLVFSAIGEPVPVVAHVLAAALVAHGVTARVVMGPAGAHRSIELVTMVRPVAVVTVSSLTQPPWQLVDAIHDAFPELSVFVGLGRDQDDAQVPVAREVHRVRSFTGLLHEVLAVAGE
ncbi:MerR family transcriptional regulator [Luteimicrobium subarcticum]|uniref:DNA-binding transcriptional MerR regulator n=1 Tax=Luteimicrobium subarcticum TaxID=620910 RepID=A0A2M8WVB3_9MICO|nr:MerR family transcriptional regulator [Luteimicrobium subarcticum]PJI94864.1 DNA-binding transcriptional MerR regulator [Luteimicrobium subarcticum]